MSFRSARPVIVGIGALLTAATGGGTASATPDFPNAVVQDLMLPEITYDAPNGCTLCHTTDAGGTSLTPFGDLLQSYGLMPYDENSLQQALAQVAVNQPRLIADIKAGEDPSPDISGGPPTPEYGCSAAPSGKSRPDSSAGLLAAAVALVLLGRGRRRSESTAE